MTGIFVVARLGSSRLFEKHLIKAGGKSLIEWLVDKFVFSFSEEIENKDICIYVVTSYKEENKKFEMVFSKNKKVNIFYGSDSNIPLRQLQCAEANNISEIISIDGDDILCSTSAAKQIRDSLMQNVSYVQSTGLPFGMNVSGYQTDFLRQSLKNYKTSTLETGWGRIFDNTALKEVRLGQYDKDKRLRLTLDYEEDAKFFEAIINTLGSKLLTIDDASLVSFIIENKFYEINQHVSNRYWKNFDLQKKAEL